MPLKLKTSNLKLHEVAVIERAELCPNEPATENFEPRTPRRRPH